MRALILGFVLAVMPLALTTPAWSADNTRAYIKQHVRSCGKYVEYAKAKKEWPYNATESWVAGFITAYNALTPNTLDILGSTDMDSVMLWLENYCKANPLSDLADGMNVLTDELYPRRHKTKKEAGR